MKLEYSFEEHLFDLISNLNRIPTLLYGEPVLTNKEIAEELYLFMRYNNLLKQKTGERA